MLSNRDSISDVNYGSSGSIGSRYGKPNGSPKERPICIDYGLLGHTIDKCYKIYGCTPGYKQKSRNSTTNQVTACQSIYDSVSTQFPFSQG